MTYDWVDLSREISSDIEYYSDRWNPDRLGRIEAKLRLLETMLRKDMIYSQEEWDRRMIDVSEVINNERVSTELWRSKGDE